MKISRSVGWIGTAVLAAATAAAQSAPVPADSGSAQACTAAQKADPATAKVCAGGAGSSTPTPGAAKRFPFPGEDADIPVGPGGAGAKVPEAPQSRDAAGAHPYPGDPQATQQPKPAGQSAAGAHPYPGDPDAPKDAAADGFSSSSSSSDSASDPNAAGDGPLKDAGSSGDDTKSPTGKRRKLPKIDPQTPEARESEDLDVAGFYMQTGNAAGAYARAKDAVSIAPSDPFAHFALAEAARKMGKQDEAREHYGKVLELDPDDKQVRLTKKALAELGPGPITRPPSAPK